MSPGGFETTPWRLIALLFLAGTLAACQYAKIPWMLPGLVEMTSMSAVQQALLLSLVGALGAVGGTFAGALCQHFGLVKTLNTGLALAIAGSLLPLVSAVYPALVAARLIESVGHMAIVVAVPSLMLRLAADRDRARVMTIWSCYFTLTFIVVALAAPGLLALAGWQGFALLHALALSTVALASLLMLHEPPASMQVGDRMSAQSTVQPNVAPTRLASIGNSGRLASSQWRLLSHLHLLIIPLTFFGYTLLFVALVSVLPRLLSDSPRHVFLLGFALPGCSLMGTVSALLLLRMQIRPWRMVRGAVVVLMALGIGLCLAPAHSGAAIVLCLGVFLMLGLLPAGIIGSLPDLFESADSDVTLVNGGLVQFGNLGNFLGPPVLAVLIGQIGWMSIGLYLSAGAGLVLGCLWPLGRLVARARSG